MCKDIEIGQRVTPNTPLLNLSHLYRTLPSLDTLSLNVYLPWSCGHSHCRWHSDISSTRTSRSKQNKQRGQHHLVSHGKSDLLGSTLRGRRQSGSTCGSGLILLKTSERKVLERGLDYQVRRQLK